MRAAHRVADVRAAEERLMRRLPDGELMRRASTGLARRCALLLGRTYGADVVLLVGSGNNGGDALHAGALLAARGARVTALLLGSTPHPAGLAALRAAGGWVRPGDDDAAVASVRGADLVVDGVVGIGGSGALRPPAARLADAAAGSGATVVAVDVPSGVDADTGQVAGAAVRADVTVTFGTLKPGLVISPGAQHAGLVELVDIGLGPELDGAGGPALTLLDAPDVAARLVRPRGETSKYRRGVVGVVAGSAVYTGAAVLATGGAVVAGAGMVRYVGPAPAADLVRQRFPEVVVTAAPSPDGEVADPDVVVGAGRVQAWVVGPGMGTGEAAAAVVARVLAEPVPVLVDADAITVLAGLLGDQPDLLARRPSPTLLTPHAGELSRLVGAEREEIEASRLTWASRAAADLGATVLLKGLTTVVADPSGQVRVNSTASEWLATAGSGDVLSGAGGTLLAQGLAPLDAGSVGAYLHGLTGSLAPRAGGRHAEAGTGPRGEAPISAGDLLACWADAERLVRAAGEPTTAW